MTTFKPFNVRETKWEVWDVKEAKYEQYINLHQQRGMFGGEGQNNMFQRPPAGFGNPAYGGAPAPMQQPGMM